MNKSLEAIEAYLKALNNLKQLNVIKYQKDFTSQLGEWLIENIYKGVKAKSGKQKDWDMIIDGKKVQVKSHAKSVTTNRKNTDFKYDVNSKIDIFFIIVFHENYKLDKIFKIPFKNALRLKTTSIKNPVINWNEASDFELDLNQLSKGNEIMKFFIK